MTSWLQNDGLVVLGVRRSLSSMCCGPPTEQVDPWKAVFETVQVDVDDGYRPACWYRAVKQCQSVIKVMFSLS